MLAGNGNVAGTEAADGVERQRGLLAQRLEGGPADARGSGVGRRAVDRADDGEVAAERFGQAQFFGVMAGSGQSGAGRWKIGP